MSFSLTAVAGLPAIVLEHEGALLRSEDDARDIIQETFVTRIRLAVVPVARLDPDFFVLSTGVAGVFVQKLVQYRIRLAIVGDISGYVDASEAVRDWVREVNRGSDILFVPDADALESRLTAEGARN